MCICFSLLECLKPICSGTRVMTHLVNGKGQHLIRFFPFNNHVPP